MRERLLRVVGENYPAVASDLLKPLLDVFSLARVTCGGDIDKFLILLLVALRTTEHELFRALSAEQLASGEVAVLPSLGTNMRSIAESLEIPKETVRRKVAELVETGWFARHGNELRYTMHAYRELDAVRESIELLAVRYFDVVSSLASDDVRTAVSNDG